MSQTGSRFALLNQLSGQTSSDERRALLRTVTAALSQQARPPSDAEFAQLDDVLSAAAKEYSLQVRTEFARLVAASVTRFCHASEQFALDDAIEVASPVLRHSQSLTEATLLRVVAEKSQAHLMAVTQRPAVSANVSHALVERGDDDVVSSLLRNENASIADHTYEEVSRRAETSSVLQAPLVRRAGVPIDLLNGLYQRVEGELRREILEKFEKVSPEELEKAFQRSRSRVTNTFKALPPDMAQARKHLASMRAARHLIPPVLVTLLREGQKARTTFKLALAELTGVDFDVAERVADTGDIDTLALLCRGARFDRGLFVSLAVGLDVTDRGLAAAEAFGRLFESVSIEAAQRALRFWKVQASADSSAIH
jgi:uncharacterized protein (DUF2336 family)